MFPRKFSVPFRPPPSPQYKTFSRSAHEALTGLPTHLRTAPARRRVDGHLPDPDATLELERFLSCQHLDGATTYGNPEQSHPNPQLPGAIPNRKSTIISPIFHQNSPKTPPQVLHHTLCVKVKVSHLATNYQNPSQVLNWFTCITCIARSPTLSHQKTPKRISTQLSPPVTRSRTLTLLEKRSVSRSPKAKSKHATRRPTFPHRRRSCGSVGMCRMCGTVAVKGVRARSLPLLLSLTVHV